MIQLNLRTFQTFKKGKEREEFNTSKLMPIGIKLNIRIESNAKLSKLL
jgi:hypothetical protein